MDLPPSGWYPDPYQTPGLLRWWDGAQWTVHTHQDPGAAGSELAGAERAQADATGNLRRVTSQAAQPPTGPRTHPQPALPATTVQPATVQPATVQPATVQPATGQPAVQPTTVQPAVTRVQPAAAAPATGQPTAVAPTAVDSAVTGAAATTVDPPQRSAGWQPAAASRPMGTGGDGTGTQVLLLGDDAWQVPGGPGQAGPPGQGNRYGYQQALRRRRWLMGGLAVGTAAVVAVIALIVAALGGSPPSTAADLAPTAAATHAATTPPPSPTPSSSPTSGGSLLSDGQSGFSYTQLPSPWQPTCPADLNNGAFTWTAGESAIAGQVNGGQTTWYGEACSGPLPQQYGYSGVQDLQTVTANLASTFQNAYYTALQHTVTPEVSQPVQVSGHAGWEVTYLVSYTDAAAQGATTWTDEQAAVIVADTGTGNTPAVFFTSVPGNLNENNVSTLVQSLQLSVVPNASAPPTDTGVPSDFGSPPPGGPGNGNGNGNGHGNNP